MNFYDKIIQLRSLIESHLTPLIDNDYILLDLPFYMNIGDILIWEGEEAFLKTLPYKCLEKSSAMTFSNKQYKRNVIFLLQGGGNFGDLYELHQNFRKKILENYPDNKIIIFPQTIGYLNEAKMLEDFKIFSCHKNLTICVRDRAGFEKIKSFCGNNVLLVPDMAFYISQEKLKRLLKEVPKEKILLVKRADKELIDKDYIKYIKENLPIDILDWPSFTLEPFIKSYWRMLRLYERGLYHKIPEYYASNIFKKDLIKMGVQFLGSYKYIYTTRLHVAILSILLGKPFVFFDNSYGKNSLFFDTWLSDVDDITFIW